MVWSALHARLHQRLRETSLLPAGQKILIALSGGQDSLCLGRLLLDLRSQWQWELAIAHCDHGWSTDQGIADHVQQIAQSWDIPFHLCQPQTPVAETENAARQWRYDVLTALGQSLQCPILVTGHTQSDRAETFLYNLTRGSGMAGLGTLTWRRSLTPELTLVRPLLDITRGETLSFCEQFSLPIFSDQLNQNRKFARNRIRHDILPQLAQINPQAEKHFARTAELLHDENDYLEAIAHQHLQQSLNESNYLNRTTLRELHPAIQKRVIRQFLQRLLPKMPTFEQISAVTRLISAPNLSQTATLSGKIQLTVVQNWIIHDHKKRIISTAKQL